MEPTHGQCAPDHTPAAYDRGVTPAATAQTASPTAPEAAPEAAETTGAVADGEDRPASEPERSGVAEIVRRRLLPFEARLDPYSWLATGVIVLIAGILRLVNLDRPKGLIFDEVYYPTDAWDMLQHGVEWDEKNNGPAYVVHPPLGKWMIAIGEQIFGYNEWGWRISGAVIGTLSILIMIRVARRMFHSTVLGCAAGLLMALDGFHLVLSRIALLDIFLMFFIVAAFGTLVMDRDSRRARWLRALEGGLDPTAPGPAGRLPIGVPWWRIATFALLGCACAVKWSAIWFVPVFVLMIVLWEVGARRSAGVARPWRDTFIGETGWLALGGVVMVLTYTASWSGWFFTDEGYFRHWLADNGQSEPPIIGPLRNLWHYHVEAYKFHSGLDDKHQYQSWPWQWLLLGRPIAFHWTTDGACGASSCASHILLLGTPLLWWSFIPALVALTWFGIARRDWRAGAILLSVAAALLPWFYFATQHRTMFAFYALPAEPFLVLAVVYVLGAIMNPARSLATSDGGGSTESGVDRRMVGAVVAGAYVLLVAVCFAYFYPIYVGQFIPYEDWSARMWLGSRWI
ncbi:dolichyl-phosphate-mannose--protein mannosyltransferase [Phytohabitans flavus]|uniref:dolichyl-phosphate-mannose--protein mannosyltransferase n=1 Tax=Phytohabitans flavus TaxID=1076124 RepID=UPI001563219A|nr:phospholipid carrier-dependent glycosyltransferase [Phytohabitans flavus]